MSDGEILGLLRQSARAWASQEHPVAPDHTAASAGGRARWRAMAELGWTGVAVDERHGGLGLGPSALGVIAEELGRELVASPLLSSGLLAAEVLAGRGDLMAGILAGTLIVAPALDETGRHGGPLAASAEAIEGGWRIQADKRFVLDGADADWFVVSAQADAPALFVVPASDCVVTRLDVIDGRSMAHVVIDAHLPLEARLPGGLAQIERLGDLARLGLAAEMVGAAERALEITLDYLKTRQQFGRPIGAFQALQHRAAQMLVELELARAVLHDALDLAGSGGPGLAQAAVLAKFMAGQALHRVSSEAVQMHGGIGMTAEHVAGRYLKWARVSEALFGDAAWLAGRFADLNDF